MLNKDGVVLDKLEFLHVLDCELRPKGKQTRGGGTYPTNDQEGFDGPVNESFQVRASRASGGPLLADYGATSFPYEIVRRMSAQ